ncbi:MAG TPA: hypothetical protein VD835_16345 [Pyrinomonadaceae bacterium]|nr:hypothetical protein [Pyrinomonadaceae bacterium]
MNGKVQRKHQRPTPTAKRRQALLVRAVVSSLVLCAALAPHALGQGAPAYQQTPDTKEFRPINARPFRDLLAKTRGLIEAGELNAEDAFDFTIEADRNADGSLKGVKFTKAQDAGARWKPLVEEFLAVLSESGALSALQEADHLTITLKLDGRASATLRSSLASGERAVELAQNYNALVAVGRLMQRGREGVEILNNMAFSANGKQLSMQLEMSREQAGNLLRQHLSLP